MEHFSENTTNYIPNVAQNMEELGRWVYVGCLGGTTSFLLVVLYMCNVFIYIMKYPSWARRHQAWITSLPMALSFLSLSSFFVPRAAVTCETVKFIYMPFIMVQFVETTLVIGGGEKVLLNDLIRRSADTEAQPVIWYWVTLPLCRLQFFPLTLTKYWLRWIVGLIYQALVSQLLLTILMAVLEHAEVLQRDATNVAFSIILSLNMVTFAVGLIFFNVLMIGLSSHLESKWPMFMRKYYALLFFIGFQKTHNFFISIFTFINYESPILTWKTIDAVVSMIEAFIFGLLFFLFFKVVVKQDDSNTRPNDSAANVVEQPLLSQPANNELNQTAF